MTRVWLFGKEVCASGSFAAAIMLALVLTYLVPMPDGFRFDLLFAVCLALQALLVLIRFETLAELVAIVAFHLTGLAMELYKVNVGSWVYPGAEEALFSVAGVSFFTGFMYASIASLICQVWRRAGLHSRGWPHPLAAGLLALAIYVNFFTNHWVADVRWLLFALVLLLFARAVLLVSWAGRRFAVPVLAVFVVLGLMIWGAENLATWCRAWAYPHQLDGWELVKLQKIGSWTLLVILSVLMVHLLPRAVADG